MNSSLQNATMRRWRQQALRLLIGLAVASAFLLSLDGALRLLPLDRWDSHANSVYPLFVPGKGVDADYYVTNDHFKNVMNYSRFPRIKRAGVKRIFILGGSAALGWPGVVETSFSGYMQRGLEGEAPDQYQVINAAAMSYGSHRVLDLLRDIVSLEPDLVIVWCGNNEYIERNSLTLYGGSAGMQRVQRVLRHSGLYRTIRLTLQRLSPSFFARPSGTDITDPRNVPFVRRGMMGRSAATDRQVRENYRENLVEMAQLLRENRIPGIFCTVPVNLSGWMPIDVLPEISVQSLGERWRAMLDEGFRFGEEKQFVQAATSFEKALAMTPQYAYGHYLLGTCYRNLGRYQDALREFETACDLDPRPIRAFKEFAEIVRTVTAQQGVRLVDLRRIMLEKSGTNLSGLDLFLDYVHPNDTGHRVAAVAVLQQAMVVVGPGLSIAALEKRVMADDWIVRNQINQANFYFTLGMTLLNNGDVDGAERAYLKALEENPQLPEAAGNLGMIYERRGDLTLAKAYYRNALKIDPNSTQGANLALLYFREGNFTQAKTLGEQLVRAGVVDINVLIMLGQTAFEERDYRKALGYFEQALAVGGDRVILNNRVGDAYRELGEDGKAQDAYSAAARAAKEVGH